MIGIHKTMSLVIKVTKLNKSKRTFHGTVIESNAPLYKIGYYGTTWDIEQFEMHEETSEKTSEITTPKHYDNSKGSLYKFANERGWNAYLFEIVKRVERAEKKGEFISDIKKSIHVLELYLNEQGHRFKDEIEPLNK